MLYSTKQFTSLDSLLNAETAENPVLSPDDAKRFSLFYGSQDLQALTEQHAFDFIGKQDATVVLQTIGMFSKQAARDSIEMGLIAEIEKNRLSVEERAKLESGLAKRQREEKPASKPKTKERDIFQPMDIDELFEGNSSYRVSSQLSDRRNKKRKEKAKAKAAKTKTTKSKSKATAS